MGDYADALVDSMIERSVMDPDYDPDEQPSRRRRPKKSNMPRETKPLLSIAEVFEMVPGTDKDAVWINPGLTGVLHTMKRTKSKKGQPMYICSHKDMSGSAEIGVTFFDECKFDEGDVLEIFGKGLRRTEYNKLQQISLGRDTEIHKIGRAAGWKAAETASAPAGAGSGSTARETPPGGFRGNNDGTNSVVFGATVGMAMKESLAIHTKLCGDKLAPALCSSEFWAAVHETASDIIRISIALEKGKLCPSVRDRNKTPDEKKAEAEAAEKTRLEEIEKARIAKEQEEAAKAAAAKKATPAGSASDSSDVPY